MKFGAWDTFRPGTYFPMECIHQPDPRLKNRKVSPFVVQLVHCGAPVKVRSIRMDAYRKKIYLCCFENPISKEEELLQISLIDATVSFLRTNPDMEYYVNISAEYNKESLRDNDVARYIDAVVFNDYAYYHNLPLLDDTHENRISLLAQ